MFQHTANKSWENVRLLAEEFRVSVEKLTPDIYAEMQGIAEGASLNILDIVALNCRSEIAFGFSDGCTSLSWKKSENARVLTQNWDWTTLVKRNLALVSIEREAKPTIYMVTEVRCHYLSLRDQLLIKDRLGLLEKSDSTPLE